MVTVVKTSKSHRLNLTTGHGARARARKPRWEPGMGMIPDPRQIGDGDGDGPLIPGKLGIGGGDDPRDPQARAEQAALNAKLMGPRISQCPASLTDITRGRTVRRRPTDSLRFRFRMLMMLGARSMFNATPIDVYYY